MKRSGHAPVPQNGLNYSGIGTEVCQFVAEGVTTNNDKIDRLAGELRRELDERVSPIEVWIKARS